MSSHSLTAVLRAPHILRAISSRLHRQTLPVIAVAAIALATALPVWASPATGPDSPAGRPIAGAALTSQDVGVLAAWAGTHLGTAQGQAGLAALLAASTTASEVISGYAHTCALTTTGGVKCWGYGGDGELGNGFNVNANIPTDVTGLTSGVTHISAGGYHTCALVTGGGLK